MRRLPLLVFALLSPLLLACAPAMPPPAAGAAAPVLGPGGGGPYRPSGPPSPLVGGGQTAGAIMPFRQQHGPGRATVSLLEGALSPAALAVEGAGFERVFRRMLEGVAKAAARHGEALALRGDGLLSRDGQPLLRCGQVLHLDAGSEPPLGLWCAGVVRGRLAVIHVRTLDTPDALAEAAGFAVHALLALREGAEEAAPPLPGLPVGPPRRT
ncbi:MAG: hypothetical protein RMK64_12895 [Rhodovarius sp.]|nr:hypothetical protein [Rhodovarius sp.]